MLECSGCGGTLSGFWILARQRSGLLCCASVPVSCSFWLPDQFVGFLSNSCNVAFGSDSANVLAWLLRLAGRVHLLGI